MSLILFLCSSPKTQTKVRLRGSQDERSLASLKQIQLSQLFLVTTVAWRLDLLKLFYQSNLPNKPCCCFADALLLLQGCSTKMISAYIVFPHTCLCSVKTFHLSLWSFCNFTHCFAPPSALPCPSLSLFFSPPLLFLSGPFQVVTHIATVTLQSPTSPTWLAPFCWWISSSTSKGVEEVEGAVCKPIAGREGGNRDGESRDVYFSALSNIKASVALISSLKHS